MPSSKIYLLLVALSVVGLLSCRDDIDLKCDNSNTIKVSQHARDFFCFKEGTWWLYEQEGTGLTDSIWVSQYSESWYNNRSLKDQCNCGYGKCAESIGVRLQNMAHSDKDYLCTMGMGTGLDDGNTGITGETPSSRNTFSPIHGYWEYGGNNQLVNQSSGPSVFEAEDTLSVNGKLYHDILHKYKPSGGAAQTYLQEVWFARNFFVIKFRRFDNTIWNLVDYNIVQ